MLQKIDGFSCRTHKANLAIHKLAIRPTEVSSTKDENALGDGAIFKVMAVHLDNSVVQILISDDLHRGQSGLTDYPKKALSTRNVETL